MPSEEPGPDPTPIAVPAASGPHRLPAVGLLFLVLSHLRPLIIPMVAALAWPAGGWIFAAVLVVPAVLAALTHFVTYRYDLDEEKIVVRHGLLIRQVRNIPFDRIQNIDLVRNPLHRLLGVSEVRLETASGGKPEAVIRALSDEQIRILRAARDARRNLASPRLEEGEATSGQASGTLEDGGVEDRPMVTQSPASLVILGLLSNRGMLVVAAALGYLQQSGLLDDPTRFGWLAQRLPALVESFEPGAWSAGRWAVTGLVLLTAFLVMTRLLSVLWTLVTLWGFRLRRRGDDLAAEYGLLTRVNATLPLRRIQLLSIHQPWLARRWRLASAKVETAGGGASKDAQGPGASRLWLAPLQPETSLPALLDEVLPAVDRSRLEWRPLARGARRRLVKRNAVATALAALAASALAWPWGLVATLGVPLAAWWSWRWVSRAAWAVTAEVGEEDGAPRERAVAFRSGAFHRNESLVPVGKIQCVAVRASPFDRRWGMASLQVDTAGAGGGHRIDIPYLERDVAQHVARRLGEQAAGTAFHW